ncbi:hypothetical protein DL93DRAFT_131554 [Clavulina sp. PMI_390]|nr:hypothetical protein DL93DRAFT_131554 [Clavulina sp. PMI_390]
MFHSVNYTLNAAIPYLTSFSSYPIQSMEEYKAQAQIANGSVRRDRAIVITGSEAAFEESDLFPQYAAGKAALHSLVWSVRSRLEAVGVRLNALLWVIFSLLTSMSTGSIRRIPSSRHRSFDALPQVQNIFTEVNDLAANLKERSEVFLTQYLT